MGADVFLMHGVATLACAAWGCGHDVNADPIQRLAKLSLKLCFPRSVSLEFLYYNDAFSLVASIRCILTEADAVDDQRKCRLILKVAYLADALQQDHPRPMVEFSLACEAPDGVHGAALGAVASAFSGDPDGLGRREAADARPGPDGLVLASSSAERRLFPMRGLIACWCICDAMVRHGGRSDLVCRARVRLVVAHRPDPLG